MFPSANLQLLLKQPASARRAERDEDGNPLGESQQAKKCSGSFFSGSTSTQLLFRRGD